MAAILKHSDGVRIILGNLATDHGHIRPQLALSGSGGQPKGEVRVNNRAEKAYYSHPACYRLPEGNLSLAFCRFSDAPLLAQIGVFAILGLVTYGAICVGASCLVLPESRVRRLVGRFFLGLGLLTGGLTYGAILLGLILA